MIICLLFLTLVYGVVNSSSNNNGSNPKLLTMDEVYKTIPEKDLYQAPQGLSYKNSIDKPESEDPWVIFQDGYYYYTKTTGDNVTIFKSERLEEVGKSKGIVVFEASENGPVKSNIWAPGLHLIDGKWYIYTCGSQIKGEMAQRMFVLEGTTTDPQGKYIFKGFLDKNVMAIDETVIVSKKDNKKYLVWSQFMPEGQCIYIGELINPWTLDKKRVMLSKPEFDWEKGGKGNVNEGPQILQKNGRVFIIYSASGCWSEFYCLGMLINSDGDFMNPASWLKYDKTVFQKSEENKVYGVGHCSFTQSPDGTEDWIVYHGMDDRNGGQGNRSARIQKFSWTVDGVPYFGEPIPSNRETSVPSGEK